MSSFSVWQLMVPKRSLWKRGIFAEKEDLLLPFAGELSEWSGILTIADSGGSHVMDIIVVVNLEGQLKNNALAYSDAY